jgi:hypothetical protein
MLASVSSRLSLGVQAHTYAQPGRDKSRVSSAILYVGQGSQPDRRPLPLASQTGDLSTNFWF